MKIICVTNEKGGSGKSTLSISLACALHREGVRVALIDADEQGTARDWRDASPEGADLPPVLGLDRPEAFAPGLKSIAADVLIVDTPAKAEKMAAAVIRQAHVALIPIQPSAADIWACAATVKLIKAKLDIGGQIDAGFVATRVSGSTKLSRETLSGAWNEYELPLLENCISNRVAYAQSLSDGVSVFDTQDRAARAEIELIIEELKARKWL